KRPMKITKSAEKITPFGGLNFCLETYHDSGLGGLIDRHLGARGGGGGFSYSDIMANLMGVIFGGGDCAEDIGEQRGSYIGQMLEMPVCSPDSGATHEFNINEPLGDLLVGALRETGQLSPQRSYTLDYDNKVIPTEKWDAAKTYKKCYGYQPGSASINNMQDSIDGRNGKSQNG